MGLKRGRLWQPEPDDLPVAPGAPQRLAADPHSVDGLPAEAVRDQLDRLLKSKVLRYSERLTRFLRFAVEQKILGNEEQIKESVLAVSVFDREPTYDSRVDSIVRVEARRLREKLAKYYEDEGRDDPIGIELPKGSYTPVFSRRRLAGGTAPLVPVRQQEQPQQVERAAKRPRQVSLAIFVTALPALLLVTALVAWWIGFRSTSSKPPLRRLTSDTALTYQPALSRDGKLLAYASDRSGEGNLDIWLQQTAGGRPIRLTDDPADDLEPSFSPDGTMIVFRAERDGGGVYLVPALGGESILLAHGGYRPRFSPDGKHVAYWIGQRAFLTAKVFVTPSSGGNVTQLQREFRYAAFPIWAPDSRRILLVGSRGTPGEDWDWWVAALAGGNAVKTGARNVFQQQDLRPPETAWGHRRIVPYEWTPDGHVIFSARIGDATNVWRVRISNNSGRVAGRAEQLTFGTGQEDRPSFAVQGDVAFSVLTQKSDIWWLPIHPNAGKPCGPLTRLTSDPANHIRPEVSANGNRVVYLSNRAGNYDVWLRDLEAGRDVSLTATRQDEFSPAISPDGSKVAYGDSWPSRFPIYIVPAEGGEAEEVCADCGEPRDWLSDGSGVLYQRALTSGGSMIGLLTAARRSVELIRSRDRGLFSPRLSPDRRWIALIVRTPPDEHRVAIVPFRGGSIARDDEWIFVTDKGWWVDKPRWSPDGTLLYYVSDQDGSVCIWAQRLDPATKRPVRAPQPVLHLHDRRNSMGSVYGLEFSVARDKLVFNLAESRGEIWIAPGRAE